MKTIYYTAREGRRNACGHTTTRGTVYTVQEGHDTLENIGDYVHQSGGASIEAAILAVCEKAGIDTGGGYYKNWRDAIELMEI